jgi:hypothetical protein
MVTRLGAYGGPRPPYGSFAGKTATVVSQGPPKHEGFLNNVGRMMN